ncbi:MAG: protein kinase [Clostridiales bacterium]|nr:protein kinase [Clostridiales bacterium]
MRENNIKEPVFGNWYIDEEIGSGSFGTVYKIKREEFGNVYYSALKVINIPSDSGEIETLRSEGMDELSITSYYKEIVQSLVNEINILDSLKGTSNIVSYEDHEIISDESGKNYTILIRMELLTPLKSFMLEQKMDEDQIVKLGMDLCNALVLCEKNRIIHRDIKPDNIFVSKNGDYKLGDFGVARTVEKTMSQMSRKGTCTYMAPEVYLNQSYDKRADIYSLGIVLYQLLNNNRGPFLPPAPEPIRFSDRERATEMRIKGEDIPELNISNKKLARAVEMACSFEVEERQKDANELLSQLRASLTEDNSIVEPVHSASQETANSINNSFNDILSSSSADDEQEDSTVSLFSSNTGNTGTNSTGFVPPASVNVNNQSSKANYGVPQGPAPAFPNAAVNNSSVADEEYDSTVSLFSSNTGNAGNNATGFVPPASVNVNNQSAKANYGVPQGAAGAFPNTAVNNPFVVNGQTNTTASPYMTPAGIAGNNAAGYMPVEVKGKNKNSFISAYSDMFKNYATFKGRTSRNEFGKAIIIHLSITFLLFVFMILLPNYASMFVFAMYILATAVPNLAIQIRRLHDIGKDGWKFLLILIPFAGPIILLCFLLQPGNAGQNKFG